MKKHILGFFLTILFVFAINAKAQIQEMSFNLQEKLSGEIELTGQFSNGNRSAKSGEPITLILTVKNNSNSPIFFADRFAEKDFTITIRNERNEIIPLTEYGERMKNWTSFRNIGVNLKSGKTRESKMGLDKVFDITAKGKYFMTVSRPVIVNRAVGANREVQKQGDWIRIASKEIEFTIE
jgi:hypothetical protein